MKILLETITREVQDLVRPDQNRITVEQIYLIQLNGTEQFDYKLKDRIRKVTKVSYRPKRSEKLCCSLTLSAAPGKSPWRTDVSWETLPLDLRLQLFSVGVPAPTSNQ